MDNGRIAEWLLAQAMEPERAAVVVGDLTEAGAARPGGWFWSNVGQTLAAAVWDDLSARPIFVAGLAARGAFVLCVLLAAIAETRGLVFGFAPSKELLGPAVRLASLLATLYAGRWIARRSFGRDLAVCVAMALVFPFVELGFNLSLGWIAAALARWPILASAGGKFGYDWRDLGYMAAFVAGVALVRRRRPTPIAA